MVWPQYNVAVSKGSVISNRITSVRGGDTARNAATAA